MKTTFFFKRADFFIQLAALVLPILYSFAPQQDWTALLWCYILLGIYQPISCFFNAFLLDGFIKHRGRRVYQIALLVVISLVALSGLSGSASGMWGFYALMSVSPLLAILYMVVSYYEMRLIARLVDRKQYV